jgi:hypothetical protein
VILICTWKAFAYLAVVVASEVVENLSKGRAPAIKRGSKTLNIAFHANWHTAGGRDKTTAILASCAAWIHVSKSL